MNGKIGNPMVSLRLEYVHEYRDRHGKVRRYFRRRGSKRIPLPGLPGSEEFITAYQAALAGVTVVPEIGASRTRPGTVNAAIVGYYQSTGFRELALGTQAMYRAILEKVRNEVGERAITGLTTKLIVERLALLKPVAARNWLKVLRAFLKFAVAENFRRDNPADSIKPRRHKERSHRAWTAEEIAQFEAHHPIGTRERLAFALLLDTVQRRGDVIKMGPQHVRDGHIHIRQQKTGRDLALPIRNSLQAVLNGTPCQNLTFLVTKSGRPFAGSDFSVAFRSWCDQAGLPKHCTVHGLRHTGAYRLANGGATTHQIMAWTGHKTLSQAQRYTAGYDQARLARQAIGLETKGEHAVANLPGKSG
jgi:integrase